MHNSLISILIPNYNKAPYLRETLDSVLAQTYTHWECIIVDDHSTDNSWEILEEYAAKDSRFQIYRRPKERKPGGNAARNYAFEMSKGEYINWFDSDDIMDSEMVGRRLNRLIDSNIDFVVGNGRKFDSKKNDLDIYLSPLFNLPKIELGFYYFYPPFLSQSCLFRRFFLLKNKLIWNENIMSLQDLIFCLKAYIYSSRIVLTNTEPDWFWRAINDNSNTSSRTFNIRYIKSLLIVINDINLLNNNKLIFNDFVKVILMKSYYIFGFRFLIYFIIPLFIKGYLNFKSLCKIFILIFKKYFFKNLTKCKYNSIFLKDVNLKNNLLNHHGYSLDVFQEIQEKFKFQDVTINSCR